MLVLHYLGIYLVHVDIYCTYRRVKYGLEGLEVKILKDAKYTVVTKKKLSQSYMLII